MKQIHPLKGICNPLKGICNPRHSVSNCITVAIFLLSPVKGDLQSPTPPLEGICNPRLAGTQPLEGICNPRLAGTHQTSTLNPQPLEGICNPRLPRYDRQDSLCVVQLLSKARQQPKNTCWPLWFGRQLIGIPYVAHTLEDNPGETHLIVNLRQLDCTTFTENVIALTLCAQAQIYTFAAFLENLETIRYFKHQTFTGYPARLHYFSSWITDNQKSRIVREINTPNPPFTAIQRLEVNYMSAHPERYAALKADPSLIPDIRRAENMLTGQQAPYIPKAQLTNTPLLRQTIHDGDIIVIITNIAGLDTQHIGLAAWHHDGLHLLNASSIHHQVVEEPITLRQYLYQHKTMPGIRILRLTGAS